ncbi:MAG: adenylate cyclase [uncultured archaeon A07HN63]|jgi:adenylyl cyclase CyaB, putative|nr:MAG: adenylate cyclase [uncultured archaeon A07HN63]
MYEVEIKLRADHDRLRDRLEELGATRTESVRQIDTYYDAPHRSFAETDEALRLRRETHTDTDSGTDGESEEKTKLTYKGPLVEAASKTREEFETRVGDDDAAAGVLAGLGFEPAATVDKQREYYEIEEYTVVLDDVAELGTFVEIEQETREDEIDASRAGAVEILDRLGLDADDQIRTSYLGLLLDAETDDQE